MSLLEVKSLTTKLQFGKASYKVVDNLSFQLEKGKTLAIVGESGSGKTMAAFSLMRILPTPPALPSEGEVLYHGKNLLKVSEKVMREIRGNRVAMIFQNPMSSLNPVYTIGFQLEEVLETHLHLYGDEAKLRIIEALHDMRIKDPEKRINDYPHQFSGGERQRIMIAMALLCHPDILIADEPTTALDVTIQLQVLQIMKELQRKKGMAILLITHDMGVVSHMADDVVVMYATQAVEEASLNQLLIHPAHPYTMGLLASQPNKYPPKAKIQMIKGSVPPLTNMPEGCHFHTRCPYVMDVCKQGEVPNFDVEERHQALCWLWEEKIRKKRESL